MQAENLLSLCRLFGKFPREVLAEPPEEILQMIAIAAEGRVEEPSA